MEAYTSTLVLLIDSLADSFVRFVSHFKLVPGSRFFFNTSTFQGTFLGTCSLSSYSPHPPQPTQGTKKRRFFLVFCKLFIRVRLKVTIKKNCFNKKVFLRHVEYFTFCLKKVDFFQQEGGRTTPSPNFRRHFP